MSAITRLLLIVVSNQGYWFGGQENTISIEWATPAGAVDAVLSWELSVGGVEVAADRVAVPADQRSATLRVTPPAVRVPTAMRWTYQLRKRGDGSEIESGEQQLRVFPDDLLATAKRRVDGEKIFVVDAGGELSAVLASADIDHQRVADAQQLRFARADIIVVAPDQVSTQSFAQTPLVDQARAGASVALLEQPRALELFRYKVKARSLPRQFEWRLGHPLLAGFDTEAMQSLLAGADDARAVQLPADEPVLELAWWPREVASDKPAPLDVLIAVKSIGDGRLVLSQLPLKNWSADPRSRQFLANLVGYLATRPEPTLPPSLRAMQAAPATAPVPTIRTNPGGAK